MSTNIRLILIILVLLLLKNGGSFPNVISIPTRKITHLVYVFEKDKTAKPPDVEYALIKINNDSNSEVVAYPFEWDDTSGDDDLSPTNLAAKEKAKEIGLPCLISLSGNEVIKWVKDPKTEEDVFNLLK